MTNRKAKTIATATMLGLGALGGVALGSNPGPPVAAQQQVAAGSGTAVVTAASGAAAAPASQTVALHAPAVKRAPIVTRVSGAGAPVDD